MATIPAWVIQLTLKSDGSTFYTMPWNLVAVNVPAGGTTVYLRGISTGFVVNESASVIATAMQAWEGGGFR